MAVRIHRSGGVRTSTRPLPPPTAPITKFSGPYRFLSNFYHALIHVAFCYELPKRPAEAPRQVWVVQPDGTREEMWLHMTDSGAAEICGGFAEARSVEHAYQASKCASYEMFERVLRAKTAADARRLGRSVAIKRNWEAIKLPLMRGLIQAKFESHPALAQALVNTGSVDLVEGNTRGDRFWGATALTAVDDPVATPMTLWKSGDGYTALGGENWLGKLLMERRSVLQNRGSK